MQASVVEICAQVGLLKSGMTWAVRIDGWQQGVSMTQLALAAVHSGKLPGAQEPLDRAMAIAADDSPTPFAQEWQRDRIRAGIATILIHLGREQDAHKFGAGLEPSETDAPLIARSEICTADSFDRQLAAIEQSIGSNHFDRMRHAVRACIALAKRLAGDAEKVAALEARVCAVIGRFPAATRFDALTLMADCAVERKDTVRAKALAAEALTAIPPASLPVEERVPLLGRVAVNKFPTFRRAWRNLGLIHVRASRHEEAIRSFTRMIELGGGDGYAYGLPGFAHSARDDYQPAEASYRSALLLQPENTEWRLGLARCVFKQEKFQDAATLLDAPIARFPDKADLWVLQAQTYLGMKQPLRAAETLEMVDRLGKATVDSLATLGDIYVQENLTDLAATAYTRAIKANDKQPFGRSFRSAEMLAGKGAPAAARRVTAQIRETWGERMDDGERRKLLKLEARLSMAEGDSGTEVVAVLEEILTLDPLDGEALMLLGQHYSKVNEREKAILFYERAAGIGALEVDAKTRQAQLLVAMGRYADALPLLRRAQEVKPREAVARYLDQIERIAKSRK